MAMEPLTPPPGFSPGAPAWAGAAQRPEAPAQGGLLVTRQPPISSPKRTEAPPAPLRLYKGPLFLGAGCRCRSSKSLSLDRFQYDNETHPRPSRSYCPVLPSRRLGQSLV